MNDARFAAYFKGDFWYKWPQTDRVCRSCPAGESFSGHTLQHFWRGICFIYSHKWLGLRLGLEVLKPPTLQVSATDASGTPFVCFIQRSDGGHSQSRT